MAAAHASLAPPVAGVRFRGDDRIWYVDPAGHDLAVGDWVAVRGGPGPGIGRVVIGPDQVRAALVLGPFPPVERRAGADEATSAPEAGRAGAEREGRSARLIGSLGRRTDRCRSVEQARYEQMKVDLPRLGQTVATPAGPGLVVARRVHDGLVTVRLAAGGKAIVGAGEIDQR